MSVAYQLEKPLSVSQDLAAAVVAWAFIVARALIAPVCAMYLATLGKRAMVRREMYGNLLLTIGGTIQQILENLQFAADVRLIEPLWRMQVLVDRASRATTDAEMDAFDDDLLKALGELSYWRDQLYGGPSGGPHGAAPQSTLSTLSTPSSLVPSPTDVNAMNALDMDTPDDGRAGEAAAAVASPLSLASPARCH
jgi:hypothetical protein